MDGITAFLIEDDTLQKYQGWDNTVIIPDNVKVIGEYAFGDQRNCSNLTEITIPNSVTEIRQGAFAGCYNLTSIMIPESVDRIEEAVFPSDSYANRCKLNEIIVDNSNQFYMSIDGVVYNKECSELVAYPAASPTSSFTVPDSVRTIKSYAFKECVNLESVTLPDNVKQIGEYAFHDCRKLTKINLGKVCEIGHHAFQSCQQLRSADLDSMREVEDWTFHGCWELQHVKFGSMYTIGKSAFSECGKIENLIFPETVKIIGDHAFSGHNSIEIPKTVNSVGSCSFTGYRAITIYDNLRGEINEMGKGYGGNTRYSYIVFVNSSSNGSLKSVVPMFCDGTWNMNSLMMRAWKNDNSFSFASIDKYFKSIKEPEIKSDIAVIRLVYPFELSEEAKKDYEAHLVRNATGIVKQLINTEPTRSNLSWIINIVLQKTNKSVFSSVAQWGLLKKTNIDELIEYTQKERKIEWLAFLMDWKNKNVSKGKGISELKQKTYFVGDTVVFGHYTWNEEEVPMEWIVVESTKKQYLLLSKYLVKEMPFYSKAIEKRVFIGWSDSDVRTWLNKGFISHSFDKTERDKICVKTLKNVNDDDTEDRVFIPSEKEYSKYVELIKLQNKGLQFRFGSSKILSTSEMLRKTWMRYSSCLIEIRTIGLDRYNELSIFHDSGTIGEPYFIRPMMWISKE